MNDLEIMAKSLKDNDNKELTSFIDETYNELINSKVNNIIPEIVFKEYFLNFFYNMTQGDTESSLYLKWLELSGGVYNEIDVVDVNGNVIYTVPPIFSRPNVDDDIMKGKNFDKIINMFNLKKARFETEGTNYLLNELSSINNGISTVGVETDSIRWYNIFDRYGLIKKSNKIPKEAIKTINNSETDIYEYE